MTEKTLLNPRQKRSVATKNKIKKAARKLFAEQGYYSVTSNKIAATANVPIGSFYNYFGNKKGVLLELIQEFNNQYHKETIENAAEFKEPITSIKMAKKNLAQLTRRAILSPLLADKFYSIIHALQFTEPDVLALSEKIRQVEIESIIHFLEKINQFHLIPDIPITAKLIHSSSENIALYIHHLDTKHQKEQLIQRMLDMFYKLLF